MPARRPIPAKPVQRVQSVGVSDGPTSRALDKLAAAVQETQAKATSQVVDADLAIGSNIVRHALGRRPRFVTVMATATGASWAVTARDARTVTIAVATAAMPSAAVRVE